MSGFKMPEPVELSSSCDERAIYGYTADQLRQAVRDALDDAIYSYSQDDTATEYINKLIDMKENIK